MRRRRSVPTGHCSGAAVYLSGQIGLDPRTMTLVDGIDAQIEHVPDPAGRAQVGRSTMR